MIRRDAATLANAPQDLTAHSIARARPGAKYPALVATTGAGARRHPAAACSTRSRTTPDSAVTSKATADSAAKVRG